MVNAQLYRDLMVTLQYHPCAFSTIPIFHLSIHKLLVSARFLLSIMLHNNKDVMHSSRETWLFSTDHKSGMCGHIGKAQGAEYTYNCSCIFLLCTAERVANRQLPDASLNFL